MKITEVAVDRKFKVELDDSEIRNILYALVSAKATAVDRDLLNSYMSMITTLHQAVNV